MANQHPSDIWLAGAFAAFTVDLIVYPLDTLKTRLQSPLYLSTYRNASNTAFTPAMFRGVYQGVGSVILATLPASGTFFTVYEGVKGGLHGWNGVGGEAQSGGWLPTPVLHGIASGTAELVSCAILTPAEVIKQNAQMVDNSGKQRVNATLQTLQRFKSNPLALWRGYTALAGRNLPMTALQFPLFEGIKRRIYAYREEKGIRSHSLVESAVVTAVSAGVGGSGAAVVTTPIDVVKTRIMLAAAEEAREGVEKIVKPGRLTSWQIGKEVWRDEGLKGLFRGGALRGVWTMVGAALYLGCYESGRIYLAQRRGEEVDVEELMG
ncbi:uncharacterized protein MYCGRDRAFT_67094 [Zymoseptoria tritici IPO323]|uniref:Mitochondrial carrier protein n=1 Tax=Zymoseptoria tritici (strain CBS 115943 / IPO323) TaxID=336722 RepID=F9WWZ3_ZYMTI|nr:uncharacterized protein MYCGRDRAFT_67094 [Zymoseptoria tritici IPO323]EGP91597.1 hypothetical protein MYCGRDRAFT_67094 [Zymoseptoria tritici IPO323]